MKKFTLFLIVFLCAFQVFNGKTQTIIYPDHLNKQGLQLINNNPSGVDLTYSIKEFSFEDVDINGEAMKNIILSDCFLPNDEGAPNLPGLGRYIALPQGATAQLEVNMLHSERFENVNIAPV